MEYSFPRKLTVKLSIIFLHSVEFSFTFHLLGAIYIDLFIAHYFNYFRHLIKVNAAKRYNMLPLGGI